MKVWLESQMKIILNSLPKPKRMIRYSIILIMTNLVQSALQSDNAVDCCLCKEYVIKCNLEGCFANVIIHLPKVYIYFSITVCYSGTVQVYGKMGTYSILARAYCIFT